MAHRKQIKAYGSQGRISTKPASKLPPLAPIPAANFGTEKKQQNIFDSLKK